MHRRRYLQTIGGASAIGLAGCMGILGSDGSDGVPDGESYEFEGSGSWQSEPFTLDGGLVALDFHNFGDSNVQVYVRETETDSSSLRINEIGAFDGTVAAKYDAGEHYLDVEDADQWSATVRQPRFSESESESLPFEASGTDYALLGPFDFERDTEVSIEAEVYRSVGVYALTIDGIYASRVIDAFPEDGVAQGTGAVEQSGQGMLHVNSIGPWSLTVENP